MRQLPIIFLKEMKEVLRDPKSVVVVSALPLLFFPVILSIVMIVFEKHERFTREEVLSVAIVHPETFPRLTAAFRDHVGFRVVQGTWRTEDLAPALKDRTLAVGLVFPELTGEAMSDDTQYRIDFYFRNKETITEAERRTQQLLDGYVEAVQKKRLQARGIQGAEQDALVKPLALNKLGVVGSRALTGELIGGFFPLMLVIFCFNGARFTSVDLAAGEKERGTLETLLLTPVSRSTLVLGKLLVVFTTSISQALLCLASLGVWIGFTGATATGEIGTVVRAIGTQDLILIAVILVPLAAVLSALLLCLSVYATSHKQAQTLIEPVNHLLLPPLMVAMLPGVSLNGFWALVPVANVALAIKDLIKGTVDHGLLALIFALSAMIAAGAVWFCSTWFQREDVLFRS